MGRPRYRSSGTLEGCIDDDDPAALFDRQAKEVRSSTEDFGIVRESRVGPERLGDTPPDSVGSHQGVADADDEGGLHGRASSRTWATGMRMVKVLPLPTSLWTEMVPRCVVTIP